jgi:protein-disulfide isomerase
MVYNGDITQTALNRMAEGFGLDAAAITAHMDSDEVNTVIAQNRALAQRLNISGTPSFVMNDQMLRGYLPLDEMQRVAAEIREN